VLERLPELGIDIDQMTNQLVDEGVEKFDKPFDTLMGTLKKRCSTAFQERLEPQEPGSGE
jgi:transaldolase/glucose-6-phosphate isomerase